MAPQRQPRVVGIHADAVVDDTHQPPAARFDLDVDPARARVQRVLDQFLDDRRGSFDDLTGGDLIGQLGRQNPDLLPRLGPEREGAFHGQGGRSLSRGARDAGRCPCPKRSST